MKKETTKLLKYIQNEIEKRGLTTEEDVNDFLKNEIANKKIDEIDFDENPSSEDMALDLINVALETEDDFEAIYFIEEALEYDKNCIEAYALLATKQTHPFLTKYFFKKAISIGKRKFPKEFIEENKHHLWQFMKQDHF